MKKVLLAAVLVAAALQAACADPLALQPRQTVLVVPGKPSKNEWDAAVMLQTWLRKASGSADGYAIEHDTNAAGLNGRIAIVLGKTPLLETDPRVASLQADGFLIHRAGALIAIEGGADSGTYYGAVSFLDRYAGVRFYMPGELWTSLPADHQVAFTGGDFVSNPFAVSAFMSGVNAKALGDADWLRRIGADRQKGGTHQHNLWAIFPPNKWAAAHPEIYPIYNGQRYIPKTANDSTWQVDFTAPATLIAAEDSITDYFKATPGAEYIAVSINDNNRWSESADNQKIIADFKARDPQGDYTLAATSDIYWRFMNRLAVWMKGKFPDKLLVGLAYVPTRQAPSFKLEDNIVAFAVLHIGDLTFYDEPFKGQPTVLDQWLAVAKHFGNHDWSEGDGYLMPRIYSGYWSRFMRELVPWMESAYMYAEAYPNWGFDGPKYYIMSRLWWNPSADPQALTRQFCDDMFGLAAKPMDDYFETLEALWIQLEHVEGPMRKLDLWSTQFETDPASRALIQRCHDDLQQAAAAGQTPEQRQRLALFAKCFAFSESLFALAESPKDEALYNHAVELAADLVKDKWTVYNSARPMQAIQTIYKGPVKK